MASWRFKDELSAWGPKNQRLAVLSDGAAVFAVNHHELPRKVEFWLAAPARTAVPTLAFTATLTKASAMSLVADSADNLHFAWVDEDTNQPAYRRFNKGSGYTWTEPNTGYYLASEDASLSRGRIDLDVLDNGTVAIAWSQINPSTNLSSLQVHCRYGTNGASAGTTFTYSEIASTTRENRFLCSVARNASSGSSQFAVAWAGNQTQAPRIQLFTGSTTGVVTAGNVISHPIPAGDNRGLLFSTAANQWALVSAAYPGSQVNIWAVRFTTTAVNWYSTAVAYKPVFMSSPQNRMDSLEPTFAYVNGRCVFIAGTEALGLRVNVITLGSGNWSTNFYFSQRGKNWITTEWDLGVYRWRTSGANRNLNLGKVDVYFANEDSGGHYFGVHEPQALPTDLGPTGTVTTDLPTLSGRMDTKAMADMPVIGDETVPRINYLRRPVFHLASDAGFTADTRTLSKSELVGPDWTTYYLTFGGSNELDQRTWYMRAATIDAFGVQTGNWSPSSTFVVSHPPAASPVSPINHATLPWEESTDPPSGLSIVHLAWNFTDPSGTDYQTALQCVVERQIDGLLITDTGKVTSTDETRHVFISDTYQNAVLRWRVMVWDSDDVASTWSSYGSFQVTPPPVVTITAPTEGGAITTPTPRFTWTLATTGGHTQKDRRVVVTGPGDVVVHDSGWTATMEEGYEPSNPILVNGTAYTVTIEARDSANLLATDTNSFTTAWTPPRTPPFEVDESRYDTDGYVEVSLDINNTPGIATYYRHLNGHKGLTFPWIEPWEDGDPLREPSNYGAVSNVTDPISNGTLDIKIDLTIPSWTDARDDRDTTMLVTKWDRLHPDGTVWYLQRWTSGKLIFRVGRPTAVGTNYTFESSAAIPNDGQRRWVRVVYRRDLGYGQSSVRFYTSTATLAEDAWVELGVEQHEAALPATYNDSSPVRVGGIVEVLQNPLHGIVHRAVVAHNGTTMADFDPIGEPVGPAQNRAWTGAVGETWTVASADSYVTDRARYIHFPSDLYNFAHTPDQAALRLGAGGTGFELRALVDARGDYVGTGSSSGKVLISKFGVEGQRTFLWTINSAGRMLLWITPDGTYASRVSFLSTVDVRTILPSEGTPVALSAKFIFDNGSGVSAVQFAYRLDLNLPAEEGWTVIDTVTTSGTVTPFAGTSRVTINGTDGDGPQSARWDMYRALLIPGGPLPPGLNSHLPVADFHASRAGAVPGSFTAATGETWTVYDPPGTDPLLVTTGTYTGGYIDEDFTSWRVYRRELGTEAWSLLHETTSPLSFVYEDWTAGSNVTYEYAVVQVASRFGEVESLYEPELVTPRSQSYWLIHPEDRERSLLLHSVVSDSYEEEYEEATLNLIGRGRKMEHGTRFGFRGSLVAHLRDQQVAGKTARTQKQEIERLKAERREMLLRTPFGDLWQVSMSNVSVARVPGVGNREFVDVTIPYVEVV